MWLAGVGSAVVGVFCSVLCVFGEFSVKLWREVSPCVRNNKNIFPFSHLVCESITRKVRLKIKCNFLWK